MPRPDDSSLDPDQRRAVESRAKRLLDRASAWDRYPTPVAEILDAADLKVAHASIFDPARMLAFLRDKAADVTYKVKSAVSKVFGLYDAAENLIHIDPSVPLPRQTFLKLHEAGHHELPAHKRTFRFFQDCEQTLAPEIADLFEREANNFARFVLFQGQRYAECAADSPMAIKTPMQLAKQFGSSLYASCREYARTHHKACVVYILERVSFVEGHGAEAAVRRIEPSPSYINQFGQPTETLITLDHPLGKILPIGRKMTKPTPVVLTDRNGDQHECLAEAFDTSWNVLLLVYPLRSLARSTVILKP